MRLPVRVTEVRGARRVRGQRAECHAWVTTVWIIRHVGGDGNVEIYFARRRGLHQRGGEQRSHEIERASHRSPCALFNQRVKAS